MPPPDHFGAAPADTGPQPARSPVPGTPTDGLFAEPFTEPFAFPTQGGASLHGDESMTAAHLPALASAGGDNDGLKPDVSYAAIITQAFVANDNRLMTLTELYDWIQEHYPYFQSAPPGWKNSIRHNLSLHKTFARVARPSSVPGKGSFWRMATGAPDELPKRHVALTRRGVHDDENASLHAYAGHGYGPTHQAPPLAYGPVPSGYGMPHGYAAHPAYAYSYGQAPYPAQYAQYAQPVGPSHAHADRSQRGSRAGSMAGDRKVSLRDATASPHSSGSEAPSPSPIYMDAGPMGYDSSKPLTQPLFASQGIGLVPVMMPGGQVAYMPGTTPSPAFVPRWDPLARVHSSAQAHFPGPDQASVQQINEWLQHHAPRASSPPNQAKQEGSGSPAEARLKSNGSASLARSPLHRHAVTAGDDGHRSTTAEAEAEASVGQATHSASGSSRASTPFALTSSPPPYLPTTTGYLPPLLPAGAAPQMSYGYYSYQPAPSVFMTNEMLTAQGKTLPAQKRSAEAGPGSVPISRLDTSSSVAAAVPKTRPTGKRQSLTGEELGLGTTAYNAIPNMRHQIDHDQSLLNTT